MSGIAIVKKTVRSFIVTLSNCCCETSKPAVPTPGGGRFRGIVLCAALGGSLGVSIGLLQDAIIEMLPEDDRKQWNEKILQTEQIVSGAGECTV